MPHALWFLFGWGASPRARGLGVGVYGLRGAGVRERRDHRNLDLRDLDVTAEFVGVLSLAHSATGVAGRAEFEVRTRR